MRAAIDIGSNSVRLLLETGEKITKKTLDSTTLADGLAITGRLSEAAVLRTVAAISRFAEAARAAGAEEIYAFGTEAVRSAANGREFCARVKAACGLTVDVLSGETEAKLGLLGALDEAAPDEERTVVDIGGASVEIVRGNIRAVEYARSLPLGMVRLIDLCGENRADIERYVTEHVGAFGKVGARFPVAIGGTATSLASMALGQKEYDPREIHGYVLSRAALAALTDRIFASKDRLADFPTLSIKRARVIGHGAIMLSALASHLGVDSFTVSERDNLEGYLIMKSAETK